MTANRFRFRMYNPINRTLIEDVQSLQSFGEYLATPGLILMQSTGLCDKNGKEVFEGDILEVEPGRLIDPFLYRDVVEWSQEMAAFNFTWSPHTAEVIGNVYEHGHLLEVK